MTTKTGKNQPTLQTIDTINAALLHIGIAESLIEKVPATHQHIQAVLVPLKQAEQATKNMASKSPAVWADDKS